MGGRQACEPPHPRPLSVMDRGTKRPRSHKTSLATTQTFGGAPSGRGPGPGGGGGGHLQVRLALGRGGVEVVQAPVHRALQPRHLPLRQAVVVRGRGVPDAAGPRVHHEPHLPVLGVAQDLDEVVAAPESAELPARRGVRHLPPQKGRGRVLGGEGPADRLPVRVLLPAVALRSVPGRDVLFDGPLEDLQTDGSDGQ